MGAAIAGIALAAGCGSSSATNAPTGADGGSDSSSSCDTTQDPSVSPCLVSDAYGVFVSAMGSDTTGDGSRAKPYATVGKGLDAAKAAGKQVFVCAGTYPEHVTVDGAHDGVSVHGGFSCADWSYATTNAVKVAPQDPGPALRVDALSTGTTVEDLELDSVDAQKAGDSSIAALVNASHNVVFRRVTMKSGNGAAGAAGVDGASMSNYDVSLMPSDPKIAGNSATTTTGAAAQACSGLCANGKSSTGGAGADYNSHSGGQAGGPTIPENPTGLTPKHDGAGGTTGFGTQFGIAGGGDPGASASDASQGGAAATAYGALSSSGWTPTDGQPGVSGGPGQGGGGGGAAYDNGAVQAGGGGGACGGCGGSAGQAGRGGGASFALLSVASDVMLDACTLAAGNGGDGGHGGAGQPGQQGGAGGSSADNDSGKGGAGGAGGGGSGGAGGTGGVSIAVAYTGAAPTPSNGTHATVGNAGHGGAGGTGTTATNAGAAGLDGIAVENKGF